VRVSIGLNVALMCLLAVGAAVAVVFASTRLSYRVGMRFDWTSDGRFKIDPLAEGLLRKLERPIRARFAYGFDPEIGGRIVDAAGQPRQDVYVRHYRPVIESIATRVTTVLTEWSHLSDFFRIEIVDADQDPRRLSDWARETGRRPSEFLNKVVLQCGDDERTVPMTPRLMVVDWGYFPPDPRMPRVRAVAGGKSGMLRQQPLHH
jgi:hypothetical protein